MHTWAEHEYEALERGCNLVTIKNEHNQGEMQALFSNVEDTILYTGGIYIDSLKTWTWADGWPTMKFNNWMDGNEPTDIGTRKFLAVQVIEGSETTGQWIPVSGREELGAVYKCCENGFGGIARR